MDTKSKSFKYSTVSKGICLLLAVVFAFISAWCSTCAAGKLLFSADMDRHEYTETYAFIRLASQYINSVLDEVADDDALAQIKAQKDKNVDSILEDYKRAEKTSEEADGYYYSDEFFFSNRFSWECDIESGLPDEEARREISASYDVFIGECEYYVRNHMYVDLDPSGKNIYFYVKTRGGSEYTNTESKLIKEKIKNSDVYLSYRDGKLEYGGLDSVFAGSYTGYFGEIVRNGMRADFISAAGDSDIYIVMRTDGQGGIFDSLKKCSDFFSSISFTFMLLASFIALAGAVIFLTAFARLAGHSTDSDEIKLSFIDKIPTDISFVIFTALTAAFAVAAVFICVYGLSMLDVNADFIMSPLSSLMFTPEARVLCAFCGAVSFLFFVLWVSSVSRIKKSGKSFFSKFLISYIITGVVRLVKFIAEHVKNGVRDALYKPKAFRKWIIGACVGFLAVQTLLLSMIFGFSLDYEHDIALFFTFVAVILEIAAAFFIIRYIMKLDEIISASKERRDPEIVYDKLPESLKALTDTMTVTNSELEAAVERALKDERMKTELITNVSHDLKTPLTSIISYVELLGRCDIDDEQARGYLSVLEEKSARLKTLVEDLVEASKASSGALTLDKTVFDMTELVLQAVGECSDGFSANGLEIIFNEPAVRPKVYADSRKTYRSIENLFSNARKYSVPGSRVYVSVGEENGRGYMQIKNMSRQMLNISPEELTERFVRGDNSRTDGGSGLGLAIAKDLCALQGGELKIEIDGDLFKASVYLPLSGTGNH